MQKLAYFFGLILVLSCEWLRADGLGLDSFADSSQPPASSSLSLREPLPQNDIWLHGIGSGFRAGTQEIEFSLAGTIGMEPLGIGFRNHNLALATFQYGWMFPAWREGRWFGGNWELLAEAFAGAQYHPNTAYVVGASGLIRYNFATGTRLVPFLGGGFGPTLTDIGLPDLSCVYNFNLHGGLGMHYFLRRNAAFTFESYYFHMSNAGLKYPNEGVDTIAFRAGFSWFF